MLSRFKNMHVKYVQKKLQGKRKLYKHKVSKKSRPKILLSITTMRNGNSRDTKVDQRYYNVSSTSRPKLYRKKTDMYTDSNLKNVSSDSVLSDLEDK